MRSQARAITILGILLILLSFSFAGFIATADEGILDTNPSPMVQGTMMEGQQLATGSAEESDYTLPFPGILPNHPLYFLKQLRDDMLSVLVRDPLKRIEYHLLMADKRLNMGIFLNNQGSTEDAAVIILKAEDYFETALQDLADARAAGREIPPEIIDRLTASAEKHENVIIGFKNQDLENTPDSLVNAQAKIDKIRSELEQQGK